MLVDRGWLQTDARDITAADVPAPPSGTVTVSGYVRRDGNGDSTAVADLSTLKLRAYATGDQLARLRIGETVDVLVDDGTGGLRSLRGEITWVAADAQFTPTPIQTRAERAELVYAFDVRVDNAGGLLKVGMPGEVRFANATEEG